MRVRYYRAPTRTTADPGRAADALEPLFGRGINFHLRVDDVDAVYASAMAAGIGIVVAMEERWYLVDLAEPGGRSHRAGPTEAGNRQFVLADPDGYLWRPYRGLGVLPARA